MKRLLLCLTLSLVSAAPVEAVEPDEILANPELEARAREISKGLRCVVCQSQDIDSSNAGVARDLRLLVRERLVAGDSNDEVMDFVRARYGDYVLMSPPLTPATYALWFTPVFLAALSLLGFFMVMRRRRLAHPVEPLTADEEQQVVHFLNSKNQGNAE
jgi:cytochrome c-type biogenesis protein CcmH